MLEVIWAGLTERIPTAVALGYYDYFPPKRMNVSVQHVGGEGSQATKKILVAQKDFAAGDVIYIVGCPLMFHLPLC